MVKQPLRVLFLCTGNSCRSIMAEAILNELGHGRFTAVSAGSQPAGYVHPQAIACLNRNRIPVHHPNSKNWDAFLDESFDLVVTVCDNAAGESCPLYPGNPLKTHWGVPDPAHAQGTDAEVALVFQTVFESLRNHIAAFINRCSAAGELDGKTLAAIVAELGAPGAGPARKEAHG